MTGERPSKWRPGNLGLRPCNRHTHIKLTIHSWFPVAAYFKSTDWRWNAWNVISATTCTHSQCLSTYFNIFKGSYDQQGPSCELDEAAPPNSLKIEPALVDKTSGFVKQTSEKGVRDRFYRVLVQLFPDIYDCILL
jgi:hypothetical protein